MCFDLIWNLFKFTHMNKIASDLIVVNGKSWLAEKLGITRKTLYTRLEKDNWKKSEIQMLLSLKNGKVYASLNSEKFYV